MPFDEKTLRRANNLQQRASLARAGSATYIPLTGRAPIMNISAAAKASGLPVKTVRYYADIDLVEAPARSSSGYRTYDETAVRKLIFVRRAREFGFSVSECRDLLGLYENEERSSADVKRLAEHRLAEIEEKQRELASLHDELSHLVNACNGDDRPNCPIINYLA